MTNLEKLNISIKNGNEPFLVNGITLGFDILEFWQWAFSDLVSNSNRGVLAEFLVAKALGLKLDVRDEWTEGVDLVLHSGRKIQVKASAYIQTWEQKKLTPIQFQVKKGKMAGKRLADIYVFALLAHKDQATINPLNLDQWEFYVLPTSILDERARSQHSITLNSLKKLTLPIKFGDLKMAIENSEGVLFT